jgi:hypothetical protein
MTTSSWNSADGDRMDVVAAKLPAISDDHCGSPIVPSSVAEEEEYPNILTQIPNDGHSGQDIQDKDEDGMNLDETAFYRITYPNNQGGSYYPGIPPFPGSPSAADCITEIRNKETGQWECLPSGHCALRRADGDDQDAQLAMSNPVDNNDDEHVRESSPSGSDYSTARKAKERDRVYRRSRGRPASDTEEEDEQDDNAFVESLAQELSATHTWRRKPNGNSPPSRFTKEQKGKARAANDDAMEVDADGDVDEQNKGHRKAARGISKEEKSDVDAFGKDVVACTEELADKWNRKPCDILIRAGLGTRLSWGPNTYNDFKAWYADVHKDEKPEGKSSCHFKLFSCLCTFDC